ncbi:MAG: hypothetical protein ACI9TY_000498 [Alphaproteobacteria bacterium]
MKQSNKAVFTKGSLPILILAGVVLFVALIIEIVRLTAYGETDTSGTRRAYKEQTVKTSENLFDNIHKKYPSYRDLASQLIQREILFEAHNYVLGNPKSKVKVVIFNDNECSLCRKEYARVSRELKPLLKDILVIYKHMPADKNKESMAAIFGQIAIGRGIYDDFLKEITSAKKADLATTEDYLVLLEKIGISLSEQRQIMINGMTETLEAVQKDIVQAVDAGAYLSKHQPVIYLNGYQLGDKYLPQHKMMFYIERLLKGEFIVPQEETVVKEEAVNPIDPVRKEKTTLQEKLKIQFKKEDLTGDTL